MLRLGEARYGVYQLVFSSLAGYIALIEFGLLNAIKRYLAEALNRNDAAQANRVVQASARMYLVLGVAAVGLMSSGMAWLTRLLKLDPALHGECNVLLVAVGLFVAVSFFINIFNGVLIARERFDLIQVSGVAMKALQVLLAVALILLWRPDLLSMSLAILSSAVVACGLAWYFARKTFPELSWRRSRGGDESASGATARAMLSFGKENFLLAVAGVATMQSASLLIGVLHSAEDVAYFSIPLQLTSYIGLFTVAISEPLFATASRYGLERDDGAMARLYIRSTRFCGLAVLTFALPLVLLGDRFLAQWIKPEFGWTWRLLAILCVANFFTLSQRPGLGILVAAGSVRGAAHSQLASAVAIIASCTAILLFTDLGLVGVAWAMSVPMLLRAALYMPFYVCRQFRIPLFRYYRESYGRTLLLLGVALPGGLLLKYLWPTGSLWSTLLQMGVLALIVAALAWGLVLDRLDRQQLRSLLPVPAHQAASPARGGDAP